MIDLTEGRLDEQLVYAKEINEASLFLCINNLINYDKKNNTETKLMTDFAHRSFYFERMKEDRCVLNGGIIFHSGSENIKPTWRCHT